METDISQGADDHLRVSQELLEGARRHLGTLLRYYGLPERDGQPVAETVSKPE